MQISVVSCPISVQASFSVRIDYRFMLQIPYANRMLGTRYSVPGRTDATYGVPMAATVRLSNEGGPEVRPKS